MYVPLLDRLLYRRPFEGAGATRYARDARPAFGDLDDRLLDGLTAELAGDDRRLLDLGCGPGTLAQRARDRRPGLAVIAIDPSRALAWPGMVRAVGEALPIADRAIDVAICLSSIRHVRDRAATLRELRRVVRGVLVIVELDPAADRRRIANHTRGMGSAVMRRAFRPLVVRTAPPEATIRGLARAAGFTLRARRDDPVQPVYVMELV
ncbi:MAG TPA: class I SAM-dependent methyltransferase [Kofleriaceae bacterium]|nr:class I SAM-dependent methyltransferase [Kofleriaceae bacterium]